VSERRVAARYAEALFGLAQARSSVEALRAELAELARLVEEAPELQRLLERPDVEAGAKLEAVRAALGAKFSETVVALLDALVRHGRGDSVAEVAKAYHELADEAAGMLQAETRTVVPLSQQQRVRLVAALERMTGKRVKLEERIDPSVIAGVRLLVGDKLIDGSAAGRLARMREGLIGRRG
jgi:F-type H+-transporting ATPase subunit delta